MRIDGISRIYEAYQAQSSTANKKTNAVTSKDQVTFSTAARDFASIKKMLADTPEVRMDKVETLKERMNSGSYNVRAEEVADKILSQLDIKG